MYLKKGAVYLLIGSIIWSLIELYELYGTYEDVTKYTYFSDPDYSPLYLQFFTTLVPLCVLIFAVFAMKQADEPASPIADMGGETYV